MEGHDENYEAKQDAFEKILPVFQKELGDVYMDNLARMKALKKDPIHKKIMATRDDYNNMLIRIEDQGHFPEKRIERNHKKHRR